MAANRYTEITPSQFNPLSLQEIMMAPMMKKQQHDAASAQMAAIKDGLLKVDPLDVHLTEANQLRNDMSARLDAQAKELATKGINSNSQANIIDLNRQYQNLVAPTGRIGQINAAKPVYLAERKAYLENAEKNDIPQQAALLNWEQYARGKYTGYDENKNIKTINSYGAPSKQNLQDDIKYYNTILGDTEKGSAASGYRIVQREDGSMVFQDRKGQRTTKTNIPQLDDALKGINAKWLTPGGEGYTWAQHSRLDENNIRKQIGQAFNAMQQTSDVNTIGWDNNYHKADESKKEDTGNISAVTEPVANFETENASMINNVSKIGTVIPRGGNSGVSYGGSTPGMSPGYRGAAVGKTNNKPFTVNDLSKNDQIRYRDAFNGLKQAGLIPTNLSENSKEAGQAVSNYMKQYQNLAFSNKIIQPDAITNDIQAMNMIEGKDNNKRNENVEQQIRGGRIKLFDKQTGKEVDYTEIDQPKFNYVGYVSADNLIKPLDKGNNATSVLPHVIQITDEDGKTIEVYGSRDANEMKKPQFKASKNIKESTMRAKQSPGLPVTYSDLDLKNKGFKNVKILYDPETDLYKGVFTTNEKTPRVKEFGNDGPNGEPGGITAEQYANMLYNLYNK